MYSHIAAKIVRKCLKEQFQAEANNREKSHIQIFKLENNRKILIETLALGSNKMRK